MRTDFTAGFLAAVTRTPSTPVLLLKVAWPALLNQPALTLQLADRPWTIGAGSWQGVVLDWGALVYAGFEGRTRFAEIRLWNGPVDFGNGPLRFSDHFTMHPPEAATATVYRWFGDENLGEADMAPVFVARFAEPIVYDERECRFGLSVFSESLGEKTAGRRLTENAYPLAPESSLGRVLPTVVGAVRGAPGLRVRRVSRTRLVSVVLPGAAELRVASTQDFASSGLLMLNDDVIQYTGKTPDRFTGCTGVRDFHYADDEVLEKIGDHRFLFSDPRYPIQSISNVKVAGELADPAGYQVDLNAGEVVFFQQPQRVRSVDTKFLQAQFDAVGASNTALDPELAHQPNLRTRYARISQANRKLVLKQTDSMPALGQISRVLLRVEHFMEERLSQDSVAVRIPGLAELGLLSPPASDDAAVTSGNTDITHNHLDNLGFPIDIPQPAIAPTSQADHVVEQGATGTGKNLTVIAGTTTVTIQFPLAPPGALRGEYQVNLNIVSGLFGVGAANFLLDGRTIAAWNASRGQFDFTPSFTIDGASQPISMTLSVAPLGGSWTVDLLSVKRLLFYPHGTQATQDPQHTVKTGSTIGISEAPPLSAVTEKATRTVVDFFDLTALVNNDWNWFTGREVEVEYTGSADGRTVFVVHVAFEIEYARRRLEATDAVTADVNGLIDDASGTITGVPLGLIERPDHAVLWSLKKVLGLPDTALDLDSFTAAGQRYAAAVPGGYRLSGVIQKEQPWSRIWKEWMASSRGQLIWNGAGQARLLFRPLNSSTGLQGQEVKTLDSSQFLLDPQSGQPRLRLWREFGGGLSTELDVPFDRDWNEEREHYRKVLTVRDPEKALLFGENKLPGGFPLDWCADPDMAQDLAGFYLAEFSQPKTYLEAGLPLEHMDLEPADLVKLNLPELGLANVFAEVQPQESLESRDAGMNLDSVQLKLRLFPVSFIQLTQPETVDVTEVVSLLTAWLRTYPETVDVQETVLLHPAPGPVAETVDALEAVLLHPSALYAEAVDVTETPLLHPNAKAFETVEVTEQVFRSVDGWGTGPWGTSSWGSRAQI